MATEREWAERFHNLYERLAPEYGYVTRQQTREFDLETPNAKLMMAVMRGLDIPAMEAKLSRLQSVVDEQAKDSGLWFVAATAPEAYLQQELRRLHREIEGGE